MRADHVETKGPGVLKSVLSFVVMLALVIGCVAFLRAYVIGTYEIPSASMNDTIVPGDRVFSEKVTYYTNHVQPGDIVTFEDPERASRVLIKRVVAVGGQTVDLRNGELFVDGVQYPDEGYALGTSEPLSTAYGVDIEYPYTVPEGSVWVMGDNRENSADSRYFGPIKETSVTGKAFFRFYPIDRIGHLQ